MTERILLGMLTPSSNTVLEPMTTAILAGLPEVSAHFGRFRVTEISLEDGALGQFDQDTRLQAADLLADAECRVIAWNGTSAGWMGFAHDEELCRRITERTGAAATSLAKRPGPASRRCAGSSRPCCPRLPSRPRPPRGSGTRSTTCTAAGGRRHCPGANAL